MSSSIDPAKLKVVDLRNELSTRGLDTKGNKAALVKRLKDALESELDKEIPDTSIADTSTEDLDVSQTETPKKSKPAATEQSEVKDLPPPKTPEKPKAAVKPEVTKSPEKPKPVEKVVPGVVPKSPEKEVKSTENVVKSPEKVEKSPEKVAKSLGKVTNSSPEKVAKSLDEGHSASSDKKEPVKVVAQENSASPTKTVEQAEVEPSDQDVQNDNAAEKSETSEKMETNEGEATSAAGNEASTEDSEKKREKRKRDSDSPERSQKKRPRSPRPIEEDEPAIDNDKVQLSWYDSDLNLQIDKESFLSAKPLTESAFGYVWAGARATHGVQSGKVCYEIKITDEIKWEDDFSQHRQYDRRGSSRSDRRDSSRKDSKSEVKKAGEDKKDEKIEKSTTNEKDEDVKNSTTNETDKTEQPAEKMETTTEDSETKTETSSEVAKTDESGEVPVSTDNSETTPEVQDNNKSEEPMETDTTTEAKDNETDTKDEKEKVEPVVVEKKEPLPTHFFRVGWSVLKSSLQLGEDEFSYAYESSGKFANNGKFTDYGIKFGNGDVIGAFLEINDTDVIITYTVNGEAQPEAARIPKSDLPENFALFPHILTRNYAFEINLGEKEEPWFQNPSTLTDFTYLSKVDERISGPVRPENRSECEVLLMCGLPASGKTHWVKEHVASNENKDYTILGKVSMLERMTISGESLQSQFQGKWQVFLDRMQKSLNRLLGMAALRRRNYIIDQTNVFPSAQRRKLRPFEGFKRRAIIVVVADEEQARRQSLQEAQEGKGVPESTILEMKAAMILPETGEWLEEVSYVGAEEAEAKEIVKKYNTSGKEAGYSTERRSHDNRRHDNRGRNFRGSWNNQYQRFDSRGRWNNQRSRGGGGWNRDRYDSRDYRAGSRSYGDRDSYQDNYRYRSQPYSQSGGGRGARGGWGSGGGGSWGGQGGWNQRGGGGSGGYGGQNWGGNSQWKSGGSGGGGGGGYWNNYGQYQQNWGQQ
ncbi:unnamed protein product [Phaedon cochleariae]|uniref:SAP domain-containing protein n=1 Tax=Phaedon cochleariae TaxID=80249 RepID=A0A9N9X2W2_PHACE|nr:unnamed protein product [Phaedon cochleariae]